MRIVMVYQHFMVSGVGSTKPYDLAKFLVNQGHDVTVICGRGFLSQGFKVPTGLISKINLHGIQVLCLGVDYRQQMGFVRRIWAFMAFTLLAIMIALKVPEYDVLLASSTPLPVGLIGLVSHYCRRKPWVLELRDLWPDYPVRAGYLKNRVIISVATFFEEWFYRDATTISAISQRMLDYLAARNVPREKMVFIPTGADLSLALSAKADSSWWPKQELGNELRAIYLGAHGPANGLQYLIEAASLLVPDDGIKLVLIGDGVEKPELIRKAKERKVNQIIFMPPVSRDCVPSILKGADVALMIDRVTPGAETSMPNKLFDYLAVGLPIITNNPAELWDHLRDAGCGILVDDRRPETLVDALRQLRDDPTRRSVMATNAKRLAQERFDRQKLNCVWEKVLFKAANKEKH